MKIRHDGRTYEIAKAPYQIPEWIKLVMPDGRAVVGCDRFVEAVLKKEGAAAVLTRFRARHPLPSPSPLAKFPRRRIPRAGLTPSRRRGKK